MDFGLGYADFNEVKRRVEKFLGKPRIEAASTNFSDSRMT